MEVHSVKIVSSLGVEMFRGDVEVGNQQTVLAPHPLQQAAPALLSEKEGTARSPGGQPVAATGPAGPPRAPGTVQVAERQRESQSHHQVRLVHYHWSSSCITALSLVQSFPSDAGASSLMP